MWYKGVRRKDAMKVHARLLVILPGCCCCIDYFDSDLIPGYFVLDCVFVLISFRRLVVRERCSLVLLGMRAIF